MIWYLQELAENPAALLVYAAASLVAIFTGLAFHEFSHAWAANELGDNTAARTGRLTLNPLAHLDPIGSVLVLLFGFGWAKPTPVNPWRLRGGPRRGSAIVSFAGPASNFFFAALAALPLKLGLVETRYGYIETIIERGSGEDFLWLFLFFIISINILLGIFNLVPIPPLDGFKVAVGLLPKDAARALERIEPYGPGILMTFIMIGFIAPQLSPLRWLINLVYDDIFNFMV